MMDQSTRAALVTGFALLALSLPLGLTFEALHALKEPLYLGSEVRREMWTLAHAHGNLLGLLLLVYAAVAERAIDSEIARRTISRWLRAGALSMPLGFFLGGVLNSEADPSPGVVLVPLGGLCLLVGLLRAAWASQHPSHD